MPNKNGICKMRERVNGAQTTRFDVSSGITGKALLQSNIPDPVYLCEPWIPEGISLLAGRPKIGKTTELRQEAVAVANGLDSFGARCEQAHVLFLSLEEGPRLMRKKLKRMGVNEEQFDGIVFYWEWERGPLGCEKLHDYLNAHAYVRFVIVDSLTAFRAPPSREVPPFIADYNALKGLADVLVEFPGRAGKVLHHSTKVQNADPIADISGTYGLTAACDSFFVLRREPRGFVLHAGGRMWDRDDSMFSLARQNGGWVLEGATDGLTGSERHILTLLRGMGGGSPSELAKALDISKQSAFERLKGLLEKGHLENRNGVYYALERVSS